MGAENERQFDDIYKNRKVITGEFGEETSGKPKKEEEKEAA